MENATSPESDFSIIEGPTFEVLFDGSEHSTMESVLSAEERKTHERLWQVNSNLLKQLALEKEKNAKYQQEIYSLQSAVCQMNSQNSSEQFSLYSGREETGSGVEDCASSKNELEQCWDLPKEQLLELLQYALQELKNCKEEMLKLHMKIKTSATASLCNSDNSDCLRNSPHSDPSNTESSPLVAKTDAHVTTKKSQSPCGTALLDSTGGADSVEPSSGSSGFKELTDNHLQGETLPPASASAPPLHFEDLGFHSCPVCYLQFSLENETERNQMETHVQGHFEAEDTRFEDETDKSICQVSCPVCHFEFPPTMRKNDIDKHVNAHFGYYPPY